MSFANDLMAGVAQILHDAGVGTWRDTGTYLADDDRPIYVREGPDKPNRLIVVAHYPVAQESWTTDVIEGVQVRNRGTPGDPRPADDDADAIRVALDGLEHVTLGGQRVSLIRWQSGSPLGQDANRRWENTQNFYLFTNRPNIHRPD